MPPVTKRPSENTPRRPGRAVALALAGTAVVFLAGTVLPVLRLRQELRAEILRREAESVRAMVDLQLVRTGEELAAYGFGADVADWFAPLLETSRLRGVLALRLYDAAGTLRAALPDPVAESVVNAESREQLRAGGNIARLHPRAVLRDVAALPAAAAETAPLLEVLVPVRPDGASEAAGLAQYWIDGAGVQGEFARLDRSLGRRVGLTVAAGLAVVMLVLGWAFARLERVNRRLEERTRDLVRANREFSLAARTSALGAITAHLIHGLRNPLAGLESFVTAPPATPAEGRGEDWRLAVETTARMKHLVNEVAGILRGERASRAGFSVTPAELLAQAVRKAEPWAGPLGVQVLTVAGRGRGELPSRRADLILLVLDNLLRNACEATPRGGRVTLRALAEAGRVVFSVEDQGPGLAPEIAAKVFQPLTSTKPGGGGLGLAISHQLARHAGGDLRHEPGPAGGCVFRLSVPVEPAGG